jgi:large subunit ribosomal protein L29
MKITELQQKTEKELRDLAAELSLKLRNLRFDLKLAKLQNTHTLTQVKREIARVLTVWRIKYGSGKNKTE